MASLFGTINKKKTIIERHKEIVKSHFKLLLVVFFLEGLILTLQMIDPYFYKVFIDNVLIGKDWNSFIVVCFGKIGVCIFFVLFCTINNHVKFTFFNGLIYHIKKEILSNFLHMPANKQEEYLAGDMEEIINQDIAMFETFWKEQIINYLIDVVYIVSLFFLMIRINFKMTLILCLFIPVPYIVSGVLGKFNYGRQLKRRKFYGLYENLVYESLRAWKEVKALALEKRFLMKFVDLRHKIARFDIMSGYCEVAQESVDFFSKIASTKIFIYFIGGLIIFDGGMTVGDLLMFAGYYELFYEKINAVNKNNYTFLNNLPSLLKVLEIFDLKKERENAVQLIKTDVTFHDVTFQYAQRNQRILNQINLNVSEREKILIVGKSGCGKTTLLKLILGIYSVSEGSICIGGYNIESLGEEYMSGKIGAVMQDSTLFDMTIKRNLLLANCSATEADIIKACKMANIYDDIQALPEQFETVIGESGIRLSGGQKQRLILARLFLTFMPIIILDEVTSALDPDSETVIYESFKEFGKNKTIIMVSHQFSAAVFAQRCIVMDEGKIVADGNLEDLIHHNNYFIKLFKNQNLRLYEILKGEGG